MALFILLLIIALAVTGSLIAVLKVAIGVALGLILGVVVIGALVGWRIRRALFGKRSQWRKVRGSSRVEVLDPRDLPPSTY